MENQIQPTPGATSPVDHSLEPSTIAPQAGNKNIIFGIIGIIALLTLGYFSYNILVQKQTAVVSNSDLYKGKITIGYTLWPGYLGLYLARDKGYFIEAGLDVDLKLYPGLIEPSKAYVDGEIQGKANLTLDAADEAYRGLDHKVIIAVDHSNGSDGIIAGPLIKTIREIKGKKVAFEKGTLEEFFLSYALEQNGMTFKDIVPIDLDSEKAAIALTKNQVDVAVTYEPFMTSSLKKVSGNKIYSSADAPGLISDILTFRTDFIDKNPQTINTIVGAYFKAINFWKSNPAEANVLIGKELGVSGDEASNQLQGVDVLSEQDNLTAFTFAAGFESLYGNMRRIGDFIKLQRYPNATKVDTDKLIDDSFIRKLVN